VRGLEIRLRTLKIALRPCYTVQIFNATCLAMALRDKLHESLHRLTCLAMVKIVARQVAWSIAQSRSDVLLFGNDCTNYF
jgi:hypothetical protein